VEYQQGLRDGQPHYIMGAFPQFMQPQKGHKDPIKHELMRTKVVQVRKQGYILPGKVVGEPITSVSTKGRTTSGWSTTAPVAV
jgi:hypothetical protein